MVKKKNGNEMALGLSGKKLEMSRDQKTVIEVRINVSYDNVPEGTLYNIRPVNAQYKDAFKLTFVCGSKIFLKTFH